MSRHFRLDVDGPRATITLDRPDKRNTMSAELLDRFEEVVAEVGNNRDVRVAIVTGNGNSFCAGADFGAIQELADRLGANTVAERPRAIRALYDAFLSVESLEVPVIAAINGPAVGVGITMTLAMDIRLAAENARIGFVFARRGLVPEACSSWFLPRVVGLSRALEWVYSGRVFPASEALDAGLVRSLHAPDALLPAARELAREIADNTSAVSVALTRQMLWKMLGADHPMEAHKVDSRAIRACGAGTDALEGVASFLEKRPASFTLTPGKDMPDFFPWWKEREFS